MWSRDLTSKKQESMETWEGSSEWKKENRRAVADVAIAIVITTLVAIALVEFIVPWFLSVVVGV